VVISEVLGEHGGNPETVEGAFLREWVDSTGSFLPSTLADVNGNSDAHATEPTWFSPSGNGYRIDFVGLPAAWLQCPFVAQALPDFELLNRDHIPAQVEVRLRYRGRPPPRKDCSIFPRDPDQWPADHVSRLIAELR
ncbi:unnamed protein product, partial [Symbiodinium sp. CCMP2592]